MAAIINPPASPIIAVGSVLIDAAPTPAKEFAVRTFGTYDKPILISSIGVVLLIFAAALGLIAWRHRLASLIGISLLGFAGIAAAVYRGSAIDAIPSLVAGAVGRGHSVDHDERRSGSDRGTRRPRRNRLPLGRDT